MQCPGLEVLCNLTSNLGEDFELSAEGFKIPRQGRIKTLQNKVGDKTQPAALKQVQLKVVADTAVK